MYAFSGQCVFYYCYYTRATTRGARAIGIIIYTINRLRILSLRPVTFGRSDSSRRGIFQFRDIFLSPTRAPNSLQTSVQINNTRRTYYTVQRGFRLDNIRA